MVGPIRSGPAFKNVVRARFRMIQKYLACRPEAIRRIRVMLDCDADVCTVHGPIHLLVSGALEVGWTWDAGLHAWSRSSLPELYILDGPVQHYQNAVLDAWLGKVASTLFAQVCGFGVVLLDTHASHHFMSPRNLANETGLLRGILSGGVRSGFQLG